MRNLQFAERELYHIYNRGVDKRVIFPAPEDLDRFFDGMNIFNNSNTIGSLKRIIATRKHGVSTGGQDTDKLVRFVAYCLNPNHYHFMLEQVAEKGIERFMHKLGMGHSKYINAKYKRSGALFQGSFKAIHIDSNEYLLHASVYVNLNNKVHGYKHGVSGVHVKSSWKEYMGIVAKELCDKSIVLEQFKDRKGYKKFAEETLKDILKRKIMLKELEDGNML